MKYTSTKRRKNVGKRQKTRKGGFFNFFKKTTPKTTQDELNDLQKVVENTSLKNIEKMIHTEITQLQRLRNQCIQSCKSSSLEYKDEELRNQLNSMIETKSDYEWGNLCANSIKVQDCANYLKSYKKIEFYKNYMDQVNKKVQQLFDDYQNSITLNKNNPSRPSSTDSISTMATTNTNSSV
jgi:uncharacterized coiled-coil DUF342 family protein